MSFKRLLKSVVRDLLPHAGLDFRTPSGIHLLVPDRGAWSSTGEIFIARSYDVFFPRLEMVRGWVDLGCNQGFFSFALLEHLARINNNAQPETWACLFDANETCVARVNDAITRNSLQSRWKCSQAVIGPPNSFVNFERHKDSVHSNIFSVGRSDKVLSLPTTNLTELLAGRNEFFDLIKIDIEGAEKFLFQHHSTLLNRFRFGICEWHTPQFSGHDLLAAIEKAGWRVAYFCSSSDRYDLQQGHSWGSPFGVALWENPAARF